MIKLSIIIVNYNSKEFLPRNLDALRRYLAKIPHEVIIADNASFDGSTEMILKLYPEVTLLHNTQNKGFAAAVNQGIKLAQGEFIVWLNPDTELLDEGFETLLHYMEAHPDTAIMGPQIVNPDGSVQLSCRSFPSHETALFNRYSLLTKIFPSNPRSRKYLNTGWNHTEIREVDWVSGACLMHRASLIKNIGGLDETFFMYCEDVDFCLRARNSGFKTLYHPGAKVLHHIAGSSRKTPRKMIAERHKSMWHYYRKHYPRNIFIDAVTGAVIKTRAALLILASHLAGRKK